GLQPLQEHALRGDLGEGLPVGAARHRDRDRAGRPVPRQPDDPHVVAEVLAAELGADAELLRQLEHLQLQLQVAEPVAQRRPLGRHGVQVVRRRVLGGLERVLRGRAADDDRQVVRRAGRGAERADLLLQEGHHPLRIQNGLRFLVEERLVRTAAALGHEKELVLVAGGRVQLDLRGKVGAGVLLVPHRERRHLRVAQVQPRVGVVNAAGDVLLVLTVGQDVLAALAHHDRGAGVLAHRQDPAGRDARVLQQVERHETVVGGRLRVVKDPPELRPVRGTQQVRDGAHGGLGEQPQRLRLDLQEPPPVRLERRDPVGGQEPVVGVVRAEREQVGEGELRHLKQILARDGWGPDHRVRPAGRGRAPHPAVTRGRPSGAERDVTDLHLPLDRSAGRLAAQIAGGLRAAVRSGRLTAGTRLPSSRELARDLDVSRGVVVTAYEQLTAEGFLVARRGDGTRVAPTARPAADRAPAPAGSPPPVPRPRPEPRTAPAPAYDLWPSRPDLSAFPRDRWIAAARAALRTLPHDALTYPDPAGVPALRAELAGYLARVRAAHADPSRVVIMNGVAHGLSALLWLLRAGGHAVLAVEDPTSDRQLPMLEAAGVRVVRVPVDGEGLDVGALARTGARAVLVTPAHQFPTGVVLSPARRAELIAWARDADGLILEDDYDAEFRYDREPVGCLQGVGPGRGVLLGAVSKSLAPALRLGWAVAPPAVAARLREHREYTDLGAPVLEQYAFAEFVRGGGY